MDDDEKEGRGAGGCDVTYTHCGMENERGGGESVVQCTSLRAESHEFTVAASSGS